MNIRFTAAVPAGIAPAELHPPPDVASAEGVAVTTTITTAGVWVGGTGVSVGSGVDVGAGVSAGTGV